MSTDDDDLPFGLYERLVTAGLKARLLRFDSATAHIVTEEIDAAETHAILARHIATVVARALRRSPSRRSGRCAVGSDESRSSVRLPAIQLTVGRNDDLVPSPPQQLRAIQPIARLPNEDRDVVAPLVALSASDLLVNARGEPGLAHALAHEIPSADSIDLLCAFVRWHGLRLLADPLEALCRAGRPLRVITTVFTGSTERKALDWLVARGAQVKVSYDTQSTRLHAKAWLFRRASGYSTAYIGSSNLSKSALVDGVEWNVRLSLEPPTPSVPNRVLYQAEPRPDRGEPLSYFSFLLQAQFLNGRQRVVGGQVGMERRHRDIAVAHRLIVRAVVRRPLVLSLLNPVVRPPLRIVPLGNLTSCDSASPAP